MKCICNFRSLFFNILFLLCINVLIFTSCSNEIKIKSLTLDIDKEKSEYILNGDIREINISANFDEEDYYQNKIVNWSLFENANVDGKNVLGDDITDKLTIKDNRNISIKFSLLNNLTSYVLCAECDDIKTYKSFSITSDKKLSENALYSFIKLDDVNKNSDEKVNNSQLKFYNSDGFLIEDNNQKINLASNPNIIYTSTNKNSIIIEVQNHTFFGNLLLESDNENISIHKYNEYTFFVTPNIFNQQGFLDKDIENVPFVLSAGREQQIYFNITFSSKLLTQFSPCNITELTEDEISGFYTDITGDRVSTDYKKIEEGNTIDVIVYRSCNITDSFDDSFKKISLTKSLISEWKTERDLAYISDIEYGYRLYFPYGGTYRIIATIKGIQGYRESEKIVSIPYYKTRDLACVEYFYPEMKNYSYDNKEIFQTTKKGENYAFDKEDRFKISFNNKNSEKLRYNIIYSSTDNDFKNDDYTRINQNVTDKYSYSYKGAGVYSSIYVIGVDNKGFGNVFIDDDMFCEDGTLIIDDIFSLKPIEITKINPPNIRGKIEIQNSLYKYTFRLDDSIDYFSDKKIYARFYQTNTGKIDGWNSADFKVNKDTEIKKDTDYVVTLPVSTQDLHSYKLMCYVYSPQNLSYNSDVYVLPFEYEDDWTFNTEKAEIINCPDEKILIISNLDSYQDKENKRKFQINNVKDETGNYKILKYKFNNDTIKTLGSSSKYYVYSNKITTDTQTLTVYAYNQNYTHCEISEIKFNLEKLVNKTSYYTEDCWRGSWTGAGYFWPSRTHYENNEFQNFPYYVVTYTTQGYPGEVKKQIYSPVSTVAFYSSAGRCYGSVRQHYMAKSYLMKYGYISSDVIEVPCNGDAWFGDYENCL